MKKKITGIILCLSMLLSMLPTAAFAAEGGTPPTDGGTDITALITNLVDKEGGWERTTAKLLDGNIDEQHKYGTNGNYTNTSPSITTATMTFRTSKSTIITGLGLCTGNDSLETYRNPSEGTKVYGSTDGETYVELASFANDDMTKDSTWYSYDIAKDEVVNSTAYSYYKLEFRNAKTIKNTQANMQFAELRLFGRSADDVDFNLTGVIATGDKEATVGQPFTTTLATIDGHPSAANVTVTVDGKTVAGCYDETTGKVTLTGAQVTGRVSVTASAAIATFSVTPSVSEGVTFTGSGTADFGTDYTATLSGRYLPSAIAVTRGESGTTLTSGEDYTYDSETGALTVFGTAITGKLTITVVEEYGISVAGTAVTSANVSGSLGGGSWSFDAAASTLTMKNISLSDENFVLIRVSSASPVTVNMQGCSLKNMSAPALDIVDEDADITLNLSGTNSLTDFKAPVINSGYGGKLSVEVTGETTMTASNGTSVYSGSTDINIIGGGKLTMKSVSGDAVTCDVNYGLTQANSMIDPGNNNAVYYNNGILTVGTMLKYDGTILVDDGKSVEAATSSWPAGLSWNDNTGVLTAAGRINLDNCYLDIEGSLTMEMIGCAVLSNDTSIAPLNIKNGTLTLQAADGVTANIKANSYSGAFLDGNSTLRFDGNGTIILTSVTNPAVDLGNKYTCAVVTADGQTWSGHESRLTYANRTLTGSNPVTSLMAGNTNLIADPTALKSSGIVFDPATDTLTFTGTAAATELSESISYTGDINMVFAESAEPFVMAGILYGNGELNLTLNSTKANSVSTISISDGLNVTGNGTLVLNPNGTYDTALSISDGTLTVSGSVVADYAGKQGVFADGKCSFFTPATILAVDGIKLNTSKAASYYNMVDGKLTETETEAGADVKLEILPVGTGSGKSFRLTLDGVSIDESFTDSNNYKVGISCDGDLALVLTGTNSIDLEGVSNTYGIDVKGSLTVGGTGTLDIKNIDNNSIYVKQSLTVNSGSITAFNTNDSLIYVDNGLIINDGKITATSRGRDNIHVSGGDLMIGGGEIILQPEKTNGVWANDDGIYISSGKAVISGGNITINAKNNGIDVDDNDFTMTGGTLTVSTTGDSGIDVDADFSMTGGTLNISYEDDNGIYVDNAFDMSGGSIRITTPDSSDNGKSIFISDSGGDFTMTGGSITVDNSIYALSDVLISGGTVIASGTIYGINCEALTVSGGTVEFTGIADPSSMKTIDGIICGALTITDGSVSAVGDGYGVNAGGDLTVTGSGKLTATGGRAAIASFVSGSTVANAPKAITTGMTVTTDPENGVWSSAIDTRAPSFAPVVMSAYTTDGETYDEILAAACKTVTITKAATSSGSSGGGSTTTTTTTKNPDGSTTTTVTNKTTGTVTETTKNPDGSSVVVETKKDGTATTTDSAANGVTTVTKTDKNGSATSAAVTVPSSVKNDVTVNIPTDLGKTSGSVSAVVTYPDGTKQTVSGSYSDGKVSLTVSGSATIEIMDDFVPLASALPFTDVPASAWYYDELLYAYNHGLFAGTSATTFSPNANMTRQQMWMVLARMGGETPADMSEAQKWAMENGVSDGSDPKNNVTREQFVTLLWRFAGSPAATEDMSGYTDFNSVADYAKDAMRWAVENGIVSGTSTSTLSPKAGATRAQVAAILSRYAEKFAK